MLFPANGIKEIVMNKSITRKDITPVENGSLMFTVATKEPIHLFLDDGAYLGTIEVQNIAHKDKLFIRCQLDRNIVVLRDKALRD